MAKDGTNRGGRRVRAGDKPLPLTDKITRGKAAKILEPADLKPGSMLDAEDLDSGPDLYGEDMPLPSEYLSARQKDGKPLGANQLYIETWRWLKERGCEKFINPRLIEAYAQAFTRYIQCEEAIILFFCGNEGLSIVENLGIMGVPLPEFVKEKFELLRQKGNPKE